VNNSHSLQYLDWRELGVEGGVVSRLRPGVSVGAVDRAGGDRSVPRAS